MKKETVLKQYLQRRKRFHNLAIVGTLFVVMLPIAFYFLRIYRPAKFKEWEWLTLFVLLFVLACVVIAFLVIPCFMKTRNEKLKILAGEYQIVEDTIVDKFVIADPSVSGGPLYYLKLEKYAPEGKKGPHKNSIMVSKKSFEKAQIGEVKHYLVVDGSKGHLSCIVHPTEQEGRPNG